MFIVSCSYISKYQEKKQYFFLIKFVIHATVFSDVVDFDWVWDTNSRSTATLLSCDNRKVNFHSEYSCGTAAIRGSKELADGQHFWEIKMTSPVYGTDMVNNFPLPPDSSCFPSYGKALS